MAPERVISLVHRIIEKYGLTYPLDVFGFAQQVAVVQTRDLADGIDGLIYFQEPPKAPYIILKDQYTPRKNFTLAHELGHFFMPWHSRQARICSADSADPKDIRIRNRMESEADDFAGELLAPTFWIESLLHNNSPETAFRQLIANGYLSIEAACINLVKASLPLVVLRRDSYAEKTYCYASRSWHRVGIGRDEIESKAIYVGHYPSARFDISFYVFDIPQTELLENQERPAKEILHDILLGYPHEMVKSITQSANGCIAAQNGSGKHASPEAFYNACLRGIRGKENLAPLVADSKFKLFVSQRCRELLEKRKN